MPYCTTMLECHRNIHDRAPADEAEPRGPPSDQRKLRQRHILASPHRTPPSPAPLSAGFPSYPTRLLTTTGPSSSRTRHTRYRQIILEPIPVRPVHLDPRFQRPLPGGLDPRLIARQAFRANRPRRKPRIAARGTMLQQQPAFPGRRPERLVQRIEHAAVACCSSWHRSPFSRAYR